MELIVDVSEDVYTRLFDNGIQDNKIAVDDVCEMARALRNGTTLEKLRADVINIADGRQSIKVRSVLRILDKYKGESEKE